MGYERQSSFRRILMRGGSVAALSGAATLLRSENDGLAFDFTDQSAVIKDTATPANAYSSTGTVSGGVPIGPGGKLTYSSPSAKLCLQSDGLYKYAPHNSFVRSEDFSTTWARTALLAFGSGSTVNATTAPNGATTADLITPDTTTAAHFMTQAVSVVGSQEVVVYVKPNGYNNFGIREQSVTGAQASFACTGAGSVIGTTAGTSGGVTASITADANGFYKCTFAVANPGAVTTYRLYVLKPTYVEANMNTDTWTPDGTSGQYWWGAQLRRTPVASSEYVSTTSSVVFSLPYEWNSSGTALGVLIEEARTNLSLASDDQSSGSWSKTRAVVTADQVASPTGQTTGNLFKDDNSLVTSTSFLAQSFTVATSTAYTFAFFAKANTLSWCAFQTSGFTTPGDVFTFFNLGSGAVGTTGAGHTASIVSVGNGWYRCIVTFTTDAADTVGTCRIFLAEADSDTSMLLDGTKSIYLWNVDFTTGAFVTSPIVTGAGSVTRAADDLLIFNISFPYSATTGTLFAEFVRESEVSTIQPVSISDNTSSELIRIEVGSGGTMNFYVVDGGAFQTLSGTANAITSGVVAKGAGAYAANDFAWSLNAGTVVTDASGTLPTVDRLRIGRTQSAVSGMIYIRKIMYLPRRMSNAELQTVTT